MPWYVKPPLTEPRYFLGAATCDAPTPASGSRIYAFGGFTYDESGAQAVATASAYDTQTQSWSTIASMPTARGAFGFTSAPGRVHAIGGHDAESRVATHEIYRPAENAWTTAAPMPTARYFLGAATGSDGLIYALGGIDREGSLGGLGVVEAYDSSTDTWQTRAPMPTKRCGLAAVAGSDGLIYAIGGSDQEDGHESADALATVEAYDPVSDAWSSRPPLPSPVGAMGAAAGPNGLVYVIGGFAGSGTIANTYSFDPTDPAAIWAPRAPLPTPRVALAAATGPDGLIYAIGGVEFPDYPLPVVVHGDVEAYAFSSVEIVLDPDDIPTLIGRLLGGVARDGGGGILIGNQFIPIPPRSPEMVAILEAAAPYLNRAVVDRQLGRLAHELRTKTASERVGEFFTRRPGTRS